MQSPTGLPHLPALPRCWPREAGGQAGSPHSDGSCSLPSVPVKQVLCSPHLQSAQQSQEAERSGLILWTKVQKVDVLTQYQFLDSNRSAPPLLSHTTPHMAGGEAAPFLAPLSIARMEAQAPALPLQPHRGWWENRVPRGPSPTAGRVWLPQPLPT